MTASALFSASLRAASSLRSASGKETTRRSVRLAKRSRTWHNNQFGESTHTCAAAH